MRREDMDVRVDNDVKNDSVSRSKSENEKLLKDKNFNHNVANMDTFALAYAYACLL